jgi:iron(III) transport system substrate-binding protein
MTGSAMNTNDECPMTNDERMTKPEIRIKTRPVRHSSFGILSSFVICHSSLFLLPLLLLLVPGCGSSKPRVVLYCAQDQEFAEKILDDFARRTGSEVLPHYDTESNKTVALYEELVREARRPRCDVFWNNEILATIRLQRQGLLEPYASPSARSFPASTKSGDHTWQAFAARARILIVNTRKVAEGDRPRSLLELTKERWKGRVAMAKPVHGTSATQAACLFDVLGPDAAREFYRGLHRNQVAIVPGNKQVAEGVAAGQFDVGITDTDDAIEEVSAGKPVAIIFPDREGNQDHPRLGTLFIPNTIAILKGSPNPEGARKLVDFVLSAEIEGQLAESESHQIPLNPDVKAKLPPQIETPSTAKAMEVKWENAVDLWDEVQKFLREEFGS